MQNNEDLWDLQAQKDYEHGMLTDIRWWRTLDMKDYGEKESELMKALGNLKTLYAQGLLGEDMRVLSLWRYIREELEKDSEPEDADVDRECRAASKP